MWRRGKLAFSLSFVQFIVTIIFTLRAYYGKEADASDGSHNYAPASSVYGTKYNSITDNYHAFDEFLKFLVLVMGSSATFATDYTLSGIGLTLLMIAIALQFSLASRVLLHEEKITIDVRSLIKSCNAALSVCLAIRSVHGRLSPLQMVFFVTLATLCYEVNWFVIEKFTVHDLFPSIRVLMFGSFFGVGASIAADKESGQRERLTTSRNHQLLVLCSVAMGYCVWPTVLAGLSSGDKRHRIIVNAVLSQTSAVVTSFAAASLLNHRNLFDVKLVQIGTAGGCVAISAVVGFMVYPAGAAVIGAAGAVLAIFSFLLMTVSYFSFRHQMNLKAFVCQTHAQPWLTGKLHVHDYLDVISSYCLPSLFSALLSLIYARLASEEDYGLTIYEIFPARSPKSNTSELEEVIDLLPRVRAGEGRSAVDQTLVQFITILITLLFSVSSGIFVGLCTRFKFLDPLPAVQALYDDNNWHIPQIIVLGNESNCEVSGGEHVETIEIPEVRRMRTRSVI